MLNCPNQKLLDNNFHNKVVEARDNTSNREVIAIEAGGGSMRA